MSDEVRRKQVVGTIKALGGGRCRFTLSTGNPDREGDVIDQRGWRLDNFMKNPVVLWAHDYKQPPLGRWLNPTVVGNALVADAERTPAGMNPFADMIWSMVDAGFVNSVSVGFRPAKWNFNEERGGVDFSEQELLEASLVPVPANAECLVHARALGASEDVISKIFVGLTDDRDIDLDDVRFEGLRETEFVGFSDDVVMDTLRDVVGDEVRSRLKYRMAESSDAQVIALEDDDVELSAADVRGALAEAVPALVRDAYGAEWRRLRGRLD